MQYDVLSLMMKRCWKFCPWSFFLLGCYPTRPLLTNSSTSMPSPRVVAEAVIQTDPGISGQKVYLPILLHGRAASLILDTGADDLLFGSSARAYVEPREWESSTLDSLSLGAADVRHVPVVVVKGWLEDTPQGLPPVIGLVGSGMLSHYDLVFDGVAGRVRLYDASTSPMVTRESTTTERTIRDSQMSRMWLPAGITAADCMALRSEGANDLAVHLDLQANGHVLDNFFDSGSPWTTMNQAAATLLGITAQSPHTRRVLGDSAIQYGMAGTGNESDTVYMVDRGITLVIGRHRLTMPVRVVPHVNPWFDAPTLILGLDAIANRRLFVSYQTRRVCLGSNSHDHG